MNKQQKIRNKHNQFHSDKHINSFCMLLKKDWKTQKEKSFLYMHFEKSRKTDKEIRKSISEFFYNIKEGRSLPLTLSLLINYCEYSEKTPNNVLKFKDITIPSCLLYDIKKLEKEIKQLDKNVILPIQFNSCGPTVMYIRMREQKLDYVVISNNPDELFDIIEENDILSMSPDIYILNNYADAKKQFEDKTPFYKDTISEQKINCVNPKEMDMFDPNLFYYNKTIEDQVSIDDQIKNSRQNKKQMHLFQER